MKGNSAEPLSPAPMPDELGQAFAACKVGDLKSAEALCRRILRRQPRSEPAAFLAGVVAGRLGDWQKSEKLLRDAIMFDRASARARLHLANLLRQSGRLEEAEIEFHETIRLNPQDPNAHNDLGLTHMDQRRWAEAENSFKRAIGLKSDLALAHYNLGIAQQAQSRNGEAMASFHRATLADPELAEAYAKLGNLFYGGGHHAEAAASFRLAASARPNSTVADVSSAKLHLHEHEPAKAEACLRRAVRRNPDNSDAWRLLGIVLKELGRFDDAIESLKKSLTLNPRPITAYYDLVHTGKVTAADLTWVEEMQRLLAVPSLTDQDRTSLHFSLGKAFDDLGDYARAISHFDEANRLQNARHSFDIAVHRGIIDATIALYTPEFLSSQSAHSDSSQLPILIVGMMRSGTTLVEQILSSHPEIGAAGELNFWSDAARNLDHLSPGKIDDSARQKLSKEYLELLGRVAPAKALVTDKMPHNFLWLGVIHTVFPVARIIHCRRNAIDTCLSIYFTLFGVAKEFAYDRKNIVAFYGEYDRLMAHWREVLPKDRFIEVDYEDVVADRESVARKLISFCGIPWNDACLRHEKNQRAVTTASTWQVRQPIYTSSVGRWRRYEPWLGEFDRLRPATQSSG